MRNRIGKVKSGSALQGEVRKGDRLVSINGHRIEDVLDYRYYSYDAELTVEFEGTDGIRHSVSVKKPEGADLGLDFESYLMDNPHSCSNKCVFCFVDQLPEGMRESLYFKDDDARLSFLTGSYITLTNLTEREIVRICDLKISPINVSVHTTNPKLRTEMMGTRRAADVLGLLKRLCEAGIKADCQIVCCPGINDKDELLRSMRDLAELYPGVNSVSIVPVGLTKYREGLANLRMFTEDEARETISLVERFASECSEKYGSSIFYCADELYLKAKLPLPSDEYYEEYSQLENGVGMLRLLETEFELALMCTEAEEGDGHEFTIATGVAASATIEKLLLRAQEKCAKISGSVRAIRNDFFGHSIDVAGLVTGGDLVKQLSGTKLGEVLYIPQSMLRHGEGVFLDDMSTEELGAILGVEVRAVQNSGAELLEAILGGK